MNKAIDIKDFQILIMLKIFNYVKKIFQIILEVVFIKLNVTLPLSVDLNINFS